MAQPGSIPHQFYQLRNAFDYLRSQADNFIYSKIHLSKKKKALPEQNSTLKKFYYLHVFLDPAFVHGDLAKRTE